MTRTAALLLTLLAGAGAARAQPAPAPDAAPPPPAGAAATRWGVHPALPVGPVDPALRAALATYRVTETRFPIHLGPARRSREFVAHDARFPSPVPERWGEVHGVYYAPARLTPGQRVPAAVVVHHLGGNVEAERYLAQHLAQNGVAAFAILLPNYGERREPGTRQGFLQEKDPIGSFTGFRQAALDVIRASDFLRAMPEVDPERVGAVGVSLGAIVTALARGVDPRLGKTVLVIGGADFGRLMRDSPEAKGLLDRAGGLVRGEDLAEVLRPVDPVTFASRIPTNDVLMLNARRDEIIPEGCTVSLWEALGRPRIRWFNCGHYGIVLHLAAVLNETLDHLRGH
ncbi:MAG: dienelactone hydrolase family protein [Planctomycetes bacterium]|nr:dienelactone hydrolase family protein [Planctomycetota bacterium]